jgi:hypothetical protein
VGKLFDEAKKKEKKVYKIWIEFEFGRNSDVENRIKKLHPV